MFGKFRKMKSRLFLMLAVVVVNAFFAVAAFAQTPEPPMTVTEIITAGTDLITDFNLIPYITVAAVVSVAVYLYARFRRASR